MKILFHKSTNLALVMALIIAMFPIRGVLAGKSSPPGLSTLEPGGFREITQNLNINIVFVGYEPGGGEMQIDQAAFLSELSSTYRPVLRYPSFYLGNQFQGLTFNFNYNLVYADSAFEDTFFAYLTSIAQAKPLTLYQELYNTQAARSLDVTENNWIDAPSVEHWLHHHGHHDLSLNPDEYTVFFINWYGRSDFKFHVYTKTDEPDPDTGYNFGELRDSRKLIAWGGTAMADEESGQAMMDGMGHEHHAHRVWFYDLSAGPEAWTDNWNLDDADLDGNGVLDYRMPPVWEYGNLSAYRSFDNLSGDLGKVTRYVGVDLLFTTSPLYKPAISAPLIPSDVQLDINVFQIDPNDDGTAWFDLDLINSELNELQPLNTFSSELTGQSFGSRFERVFNCFSFGPSCFGNRIGDAFADLFLYFNDQIIRFLEGDGDYEVPVFAFNSTDDNLGDQFGLLGFADDNWVDGTQSYVFGFDTPGYRDLGYGFTTTTIHEVGHHLGMSHPHDGYDYQADVDFGPGDEFYFAWSGDESNSTMSYIDLNWDFSQFDMDNMNRYLTSIYINQANTILAKIYASPRAGRAQALLVSADEQAAMALDEYAAMSYDHAAHHAKMAYEAVVAAAGQVGVQIEPQSWQADYKAKGASDKFVDRVDYQRNKP